MRARIGVTITALAVSGGCLSTFPFEHEPTEKQSAIGTVTVSAPLFRPLESSQSVDRRLDFGKNRATEELWLSVQQANGSVADVRTRSTELAIAFAPTLAAAVAAASGGGAGEGADAASGDADGDDAAAPPSTAASSESSGGDSATSAGDAPENAAKLPQQLVVDPDALKSMLKLLDRSDADYLLPPDQTATLVAAYQTLMVNLEDFYNADGFDYSSGRALDWLPYKAHFNVVVDPGWHTRYRPHEAVVEITMGSETDMRVLAVMPPETAQAIDQVTSSFRQLATAIAGNASYSGVDLSAQVRDIAAAAHRLEGLRAHKPFVVTFPQSNRISVKFRPLVAPTAGRSDMQPQSRLLTALVLVKNQTRSRAEDGASASAKDSLIPEAEDRAVESLGLTDRFLGGAKGGSGVGTESVQANDSDASRITLLPRSITVHTRASFLPAAVEESAWFFGDGTLDAPSRATFSFPWFREGWRSLDAGASRHECEIPPWLGDARAQLEVVEAGGLYWFDLDPIADLQADLSLAKEKLMVVEREVEELEAKLKALPEPKDDPAKAAFAAAKAALESKKEERKREKDIVTTKRSKLLAAIPKQLKCNVQLQFGVKGPLVTRAPGVSAPTYERTAFVARAARIRDAATLTAPFELLGASPGGYTLTASGLDLDGVVALDSKDELKFGTAMVVLEVGVIRASQLGDEEALANPKRVAVRVALQHGANTPPVPAEAKPDADKDKASTLQLKIEGVKLDFNPAKS